MQLRTSPISGTLVFLVLALDGTSSALRGETAATKLLFDAAAPGAASLVAPNDGSDADVTYAINNGGTPINAAPLTTTAYIDTGLTNGTSVSAFIVQLGAPNYISVSFSKSNSTLWTTDGASAIETSLGTARSISNYHVLVVGTATAAVAPMYIIDATSMLDLADNDMAILYGSVNFNDFSIIQNHFGQAGGWSSGDFNYDGTVNLNDFSLL